jgi:hypothetical protein
MKHIITYISILFFAGIIISSCTKDFEEIDHNTLGFTSATDGSLFNGILKSLVPGGNELFYLNNEFIVGEAQLEVLTTSAWGNYTIGTDDVWNNYYLSLANIRELEYRFDEQGSSPELNNMKAMLKIVKALKTFKVTDIFGDMPYSQAGRGFQSLELLRPAYDSQEEIYISLLEDLKWCDENIADTAVTNEPFLTFKAFDTWFNGELLDWQKLANSLRLRYAMRMSNKNPELAAEIISEIIENERPVFLGYDFITPIGEAACIWPSRIGFQNNAPDWAMREHKNLRMGSNMWKQLSYHDSTDGSGIFDPRAFLFFETNNSKEWVAYPQIPGSQAEAPGGIPFATHRDSPAGFDIKGDDNVYSTRNYFAHRDANNFPIPIITGAEVHYILAEAYMRGIGVAQDLAQADIEYMNGINSSVEFWMDVADNSYLPESGIKWSDKFSIPSGVNVASVIGAFGSWNAPTDEDRLRFLYTQRWIDAFMQPQEAWALARRTGMTPREGDPVSIFRFPYPVSEQEYNTENWQNAKAAQGGDDFEDKIWWIPE